METHWNDWALWMTDEAIVIIERWDRVWIRPSTPGLQGEWTIQYRGDVYDLPENWTF